MQRRTMVWGGLASSLGLIVLAACGASANDESGAGDLAGPQGTSDAGANQYPGTGGSGGGFADAAAEASLPPEEELESSYESPVATGRFVWVTNPVSGRVAYVDAASLEVRTVPAGNGPRYMAPVPSDVADVAVVINTLSNDATILRAASDGSIGTTMVGIAAGANSWAISHDGRWGIAWANARAVSNPDPVQGFQDITVVALSEGNEVSTRLSVGYRPATLSFSSDDKQAYAVTQDGVSVVDLELGAAPQATRVVPISDDPFEDPDTRDVSITPDGAYALVRRDGQAYITIVSLADGTLEKVTLPAACTDLDLSPDGTRALAVLRDINAIAILPVPEITSEPTEFELVQVGNATVGSIAIAAEAPLALAYTNAIEEMRITSVGFATSPAQVKTMKLHGAVSSVFPSFTGASAIVIHQPMQGTPGAFSALSLAPELPARIQSTLAPVTAVALTPAGDRAVVAERDDTTRIYGAYLVRSSTQQVDRYSLASPPIAVGTVVDAKRAYIAQEHPEGRLTFIDLDTGLARTLTGFELGARVIDGSNP